MIRQIAAVTLVIVRVFGGSILVKRFILAVTSGAFGGIAEKHTSISILTGKSAVRKCFAKSLCIAAAPFGTRPFF